MRQPGSAPRPPPPRRRAATMAVWPIGGKIPDVLSSMRPSCRRGPVPAGPALGADERRHVVGHLQAVAERASHRDPNGLPPAHQLLRPRPRVLRHRHPHPAADEAAPAEDRGGAGAERDRDRYPGLNHLASRRLVDGQQRRNPTSAGWRPVAGVMPRVERSLGVGAAAGQLPARAVRVVRRLRRVSAGVRGQR